MNKELADKIETNRKEYNLLVKDDNYTNVRFNEKTGGLSAIHREHNFDPTIGKFGIPRGDYERISLDVLYDYGKNVVLESEKSALNKKFSEGFLDGKRFDIKGIEGTGGRNIIDKISYAGKQGAEYVVLYFHDTAMFDRQKIINAYNGYLNLSKTKRVKKRILDLFGNSLIVQIHVIYCSNQIESERKSSSSVSIFFGYNSEYLYISNNIFNTYPRR